jgi:hypothetical protein
MFGGLAQRPAIRLNMVRLPGSSFIPLRMGRHICGIGEVEIIVGACKDFGVAIVVVDYQGLPDRMAPAQK